MKLISYFMTILSTYFLHQCQCHKPQQQKSNFGDINNFNSYVNQNSNNRSQNSSRQTNANFQWENYYNNNNNNHAPISNGKDNKTTTANSNNVKRDNIGDSASTQKCRCVRKEGSTDCFEYDLRRQAVTFEEAVVYFPDVLVAQPDAAPSKPATEKNPISYWCQRNKFCKECANAIMTHVHTQGYLSSEDLYKERQKFGFNDTNDDDSCVWSYCWRLQYSKGSPPGGPPRHGPPPPHQPPHSPHDRWPQQQSTPRYDNRMDVENERTNEKPTPKPSCKGKTSSSQTLTTNRPSPSDKTVEELIRKGNDYWQNATRQSRGKRQTVGSNSNVTLTSENLGNVFQIDCLRRGDVVDSDGMFVSLCNICWVWRRLPSDYFPMYLNEFICDTDRKCLSGFGECMQRTRPVDLLRNYGNESNPVWRVVTIGSPTFCECEARFGSEFHRLVSA